MYPLPGTLTYLAHSYSCFGGQISPPPGSLPVSISGVAPAHPPICSSRFSHTVVHEFLPPLGGLKWAEPAPAEFTAVCVGLLCAGFSTDIRAMSEWSKAWEPWPAYRTVWDTGWHVSVFAFVITSGTATCPWWALHGGGSAAGRDGWM